MSQHVSAKKALPLVGGIADPHRFRALTVTPSAVEELDEQGDFIFHFRLDPPSESVEGTLVEYYRESIGDLLKIVRFYSRGEPIIVDSFAFLNEPQEQIAILSAQDGA